MKAPRSKYTDLALVEVPFYGESIQAVKAPDGKIWVHLKRVCEALGIDFSAQRTRLNAADWTCMAMIATQVEGDQRRRVLMIDHESLPMWLVTIHPSKVAFAVRDKLKVYQKEAKAVLAAWFQGTSASNPDLAVAFQEVKEKLRLAEARSEGALSTARQLQLENQALDARVNSFIRPLEYTEGGEYLALREFCDRYRIAGLFGHRISGAQLRVMGRALSDWSKMLGQPVKSVRHPRFGVVNAYRIEILQQWASLGSLALHTPSAFFKRLMMGRLFA